MNELFMKKIATYSLAIAVIFSTVYVHGQLGLVQKDIALIQNTALLASTSPSVDTQSKVLLLGGKDNSASRNDVFSSTGMQTWTTIVANNAQNTAMWSPRVNANTIYFDNKYWVIGTSHWNSPSNNINSPNDIWSSVDGINWKYVTGKPPFNNYYAPFTNDFEGYYEYRAVVLGEKMFVIGGKPGNNNKAVVWSSADGIRWEVVNAATPFENRTLFSVTAFNGKMYVIGGRYSMNAYGNSGVWSSTDGGTWTQVNAAPEFSNYLSDAKTLVFNNKIYLLGGLYQTTTNGYQSAKVWASSNGANWSLVNTTLPDASHTSFSTRDAIVSDGKIWLGSATYNGVANKLWSSSDALTWTQNRMTPQWSMRFGYRFISKNK